jgi:acetyl-CoA acetyltransferase family protein
MPPDHRHRVAIVAGTRTPFVKAGTVFKRYSALDLGVHAVAGLLERSGLPPDEVEQLVYGTVIADPLIPNLAREIVFKTPLPSTVHAYTVSNNCITGIHAITAIADAIVDGRIEIGIAGGAESMSNPPVMWTKRASQAVLDAARAKSFGSKLAALARIRPWDLKAVAPGIKEPSTGLSMGEHTELMAKEWKIARQEQDEIAYRSHMRAHAATEDGRLKSEIYPLDGIDCDLLIRPDTSLERLAKLPPVFDPSAAGTITAGNSSPLTDGASAVLLMSEERAQKEGHEPLAFLRAFEYTAIDPSDGLLMAPAVAVPRLLAKTELKLSDMDIVEMHEAFAAQVACNLRAWEHGWKEPAIGRVDPEILNPLGSSIAVGHPFAATGGRIATTLANEMKRRGARHGLVSVCAAGAMAAAMILERP